MRYNADILNSIVQLLQGSPESEYREVLQTLSAQYKARITPDSLECAFKRAGLETPRSYMKKHFAPLEEYEAKRTQAEERSQIKELLEELRIARARQAFLDRASNGAVPILPKKQKTSGHREMCAVLLLSDLHVEEQVQAIEPFEEYTLDIAARRLEKLFQGAVDLVKHHRADGHYLIDYMVSWLGGDFMTGYIHDDNIQTSQLSPTETILWLLPRIEGGLRYLVSELDLGRLEVPCSFGNHGRCTPKPMVAVAAENSFEWLMYHMLAARMKDEPRIHFEITKSAQQFVQVYDWLLRFHHGDHIQYQGGVLGPGVPFTKAVDAWNYSKPCQYTHIGHYHNYGVYRVGVMNGAMIGYSPYAAKVKARKEDPAQAFYLLDSKRGPCQHTKVWL